MKRSEPKKRPPDLVAFGEVLWDIFQSPARRRAPDLDLFRREIGGAPANVCVHVARLGGRAAVVGAVGRDRFGEDLEARLRNEGVDTSTLARRAERTGIAFVLHADDGQPRFLFYRKATADMAFGVADLPKILPRARYALVGSSTLVVPPLAEATRAFMRRMLAQESRLFVDLNVRAHLWTSKRAMRGAIGALVGSATFIKASADDLEALDVGREARAISWLRARTRPEMTLFLTRGSGVASAFGTFGRVDVPARPSRCIDATGAGDSFVAAVVRVFSALSEAERTEPSALAVKLAMELGNRMGARVVRGLGAAGADTRPLRPILERGVARHFARLASGRGPGL